MTHSGLWAVMALRASPQAARSKCWRICRTGTFNRPTPSARAYQPTEEPEYPYPYHDRSVHVTQCGRICIGRRKINLSTVFAGQTVGIREVADKIWLVSFMDYDLGFFDEDVGRVEPAANPFVPEL